ncbi:MAG: retron St85 family effector protein [Candidatus Auribacterota bacterium]
MIDVLYENIFKKYSDKSINIFLCGKVDGAERTIREQLREEYKDTFNFNIIFAEEILVSLLKSRDYNLLDLENDLANDVDVIVLPLESPGTFTELGAFSSFDKLRDKLLILNKKEFEDQKSFINLGPIRLLKQRERKNIIYYENNILSSEIIEKIKNRIRAIHINKKRITGINQFQEYHWNLNNFFNFSRFLLFTIGLFQPVSKTFLQEKISTLDLLDKRHFNKLFETSENILFNQRKIKIVQQGPPTLYGLSEDGHNLFFDEILATVNYVKKFCKIRLKYLYKQLKTG